MNQSVGLLNPFIWPPYPASQELVTGYAALRSREPKEKVSSALGNSLRLR